MIGIPKVTAFNFTHLRR